MNSYKMIKMKKSECSTKWTDEQEKERLVCEIKKANKNLKIIAESMGVKTLRRALSVLGRNRGVKTL